MSKALKRDQKKLKDARTAAPLGERKAFSRDAYQTHNDSAVTAVLEYLDDQDLWAQENDDKYGPDIVVWTGFRPTSYIEVEQRTAWKTGPWPEHWAEIHIPERKGHMYFSLALPCEHWILSADSSNALIVPDYIIREHKDSLREFRNAKVKEGELFYHIPLESCIQKELPLSSLRLGE